MVERLTTEPIVLGGSALVLGAAVAFALIEMFDRRDRRRTRRLGSAEAFWHAYLTQPPVSIDHRLGRLVVGRTGVLRFCKTCFAPLSGPLAPLLRPVGHGPSPRNPNLCHRCAVHVPVGGAEVEITVLFADLRGSIGLAEEVAASEFSTHLTRFYESAVPILVRHGAIVDRLVGDQVMALFVPAFAGAAHAARAVEAGAEVLRSAPPGTDIGIGVHTGPAFVGVVGVPHGITDFTAAGDTVNIAALLASDASSGELVYTDRTAQSLSGDEDSRRSPALVTVPGRHEPVAVFSIRDEAPHDRVASTRRRRRTGRVPSVGWDSLTDTERDVARLVADGLTNRDVAKRLVMSPYTVDTHLRHVFAKLRLRSRVALAAEVTRQQAEHDVVAR